jgi:quercetin dioxygenase-like cupin family protein
MTYSAANDDRGPPLRLDRLPPSFLVREVVIGAGADLAYRPADWHDALVVVRSGTVEVEFLAGSLRRFDRGDILWLDGLPVRSLRNRGSSSCVLVAVSRVRSAAVD